MDRDRFVFSKLRHSSISCADYTDQMDKSMKELEQNGNHVVSSPHSNKKTKDIIHTIQTLRTIHLQLGDGNSKLRHAIVNWADCTERMQESIMAMEELKELKKLENRVLSTPQSIKKIEDIIHTIQILRTICLQLADGKLKLIHASKSWADYSYQMKKSILAMEELEQSTANHDVSSPHSNKKTKDIILTIQTLATVHFLLARQKSKLRCVSIICDDILDQLDKAVMELKELQQSIGNHTLEINGTMDYQLTDDLKSKLRYGTINWADYTDQTEKLIMAMEELEQSTANHVVSSPHSNEQTNEISHTIRKLVMVHFQLADGKSNLRDVDISLDNIVDELDKLVMAVEEDEQSTANLVGFSIHSNKKTKVIIHTIERDGKVHFQLADGKSKVAMGTLKSVTHLANFCDLFNFAEELLIGKEVLAFFDNSVSQPLLTLYNVDETENLNLKIMTLLPELIVPAKPPTPSDVGVAIKCVVKTIIDGFNTHMVYVHTDMYLFNIISSLADAVAADICQRPTLYKPADRIFNMVLYLLVDRDTQRGYRVKPIEGITSTTVPEMVDVFVTDYGIKDRVCSKDLFRLSEVFKDLTAYSEQIIQVQVEEYCGVPAWDNTVLDLLQHAIDEGTVLKMEAVEFDCEIPVVQIYSMIEEECEN